VIVDNGAETRNCGLFQCKCTILVLAWREWGKYENQLGMPADGSRFEPDTCRMYIEGI
jgi:hypothetical protein